MGTGCFPHDFSAQRKMYMLITMLEGKHRVWGAMFTLVNTSGWGSSGEQL